MPDEPEKGVPKTQPALSRVLLEGSGLMLAPWLVMALFSVVITFLAPVSQWLVAAVGLVVGGLLGGYIWIFTAFAKRSVQHEFKVGSEWRTEQKVDLEALSHSIEEYRKTADDQKAQALAAVQKQMNAAITNIIEDSRIPPQSTFAVTLGTITQAAEWFGDKLQYRFGRMSYILDRLQSRIADEYTDVSSRTAWLMTGQSFLLGAFVAILNVTSLPVEQRRWLAAGVAFSGAFTSFLLMLSAFFAHALIELLKPQRDIIETSMEKEFGTPRAGVPIEAHTHRFGHAATRYLPSFAYVAWVFLTILVLGGQFTLAARPDPPVLFQITDAGGGLTRYKELSPAFPLGATRYEHPPAECDDNTARADVWVEDVAKTWIDRQPSSATDWLVLVGGADRTNLSENGKRQFDANVTLARGRAEHIKRRLTEKVARLTKDPAKDQLTDERVLVLVTGPNVTPPTDRARKRADCRDDALSVDRKVQVWLPSSK